MNYSFLVKSTPLQVSFKYFWWKIFRTPLLVTAKMSFSLQRCKFAFRRKSKALIKLTKTDLQCFCLYFIRHLLKRRDVLQIGCSIEKVIGHIILIWTIKFNVKHVKQNPLEVCITWKVVRFLEFYIFPGYKNNMPLVVLLSFNTVTW